MNAYEHILESNTSPDVLEYDSEGKPHHLIGDRNNWISDCGLLISEGGMWTLLN